VHIGIKAMPSFLLGAQKLDETSQNFWLVCVFSSGLKWMIEKFPQGTILGKMTKKGNIIIIEKHSDE
jgi:hypothetical protein